MGKTVNGKIFGPEKFLNRKTKNSSQGICFSGIFWRKSGKWKL